MAVTDSRVKKGVLTLVSGTDTYSAECQVTNVRITPGTTSDDTVEVLCGDVVGGASAPEDSLNLESIQDFDDAAGFVAFSWRNRGKEATFTWKPNTAAGEWTGKVIVKAVEVGGEVGTQLRTSAEWKITSLTPPTGFGDGSIGGAKATADDTGKTGK